MLKDRLFYLGISLDEACYLCDCAAEIYEHLLYQCSFSKILMTQMMQFLNIRLSEVDTLQWIQRKPWAKVKKMVVNAFVQACWYTIWQQRNKARLEMRVFRQDKVLHEIILNLKLQAAFWLSCSNRRDDTLWISSLFRVNL
ncbi:hypothetical protein RND81_07G039200 [Saponaria officinalis]|uniref:Reverse transcriptase zinc-binding domain-containing protein n=1 Tax=Saponaria officinalis TaxID=3572 RepID=A0AAW1JMV7_SAPOF